MSARVRAIWNGHSFEEHAKVTLAKGKHIGIVTDRDVVRCLVRNGGSLNDVLVRSALTPDPLVLLEEDDVAQAIDRLRARGVRRAPVVDRHGVLLGVVSVDDLFAWLAGQLDHLARLVEIQPTLARR